jgi:hypothetical protein
VTLFPIALGILATALAAAITIGWIAIGSVFLRSLRDDDPLTVPASLLIGNGIVAFLLAIQVATGHVTTAAAFALGAPITAAILERDRLIRLLRNAIPLADRSWGLLISISYSAIGLVCWLSAIAPPRSADAMRYHLAHIKQIVAEGRWVAIPDYHYALPFGWSMSYLPFEIFGLAQGAQLLSTCVFAVLVSTVVRQLAAWEISRPAIMLASLLLLHPVVLRLFSEASADGYSLLAILAIVLLLVRQRETGASHFVLFGFVSWIGIQSRYQLVASGLAALIVLFIPPRGMNHSVKKVTGYFTGCAAALLLASPFYVSNYSAFGNPVWPLMVSKAAARQSYANLMARDYSESLTGSYAVRDVVESMWTLVSTPFLFPLVIVMAVVVGFSLRIREREPRVVSHYALAFGVLWLLMAPLLYPRFALLLLPPALICTGFLFEEWMRRSKSLARLSRMTVSVGALIFAVSSIVVFRDNIRYAFSGDLETYHRYTWFYRVFQWVNSQTPRNARVLVILSSGHTYYLERPYRRADPWISGVVDWNTVSTGQALSELMDRERYSYVLYENRDWHWFGGGLAMQNAVSDAVSSGSLTPVRHFTERLYNSRVRRRFTTANVYVLRHNLPSVQ